MIELEKLGIEIKTLILKYGMDVLIAILTLLIGFRIIKIIDKIFSKSLDKAKIDISLHAFLRKLLSGTLKIALIISVATMLGVETTSFIAVLGGAGLAIGLALQGSLSNFAGGVLLLILKPFKIGDFIEANGESGLVKEIDLFNTVLNTPDNKIIFIPNGSLSNGTIINYSREEKRRVDLVFGIGYDDDILQAKNVLKTIIEADERILQDPEYMIAVSELADSSVNLLIRVWTKSENYWPLTFDLTEKVKLEFDKNNISIPFPQRDIHVYSESK